jgi:DsbC/DsbD-like thiol-disulfide interchange protein
VPQEVVKGLLQLTGEQLQRIPQSLLVIASAMLLALLSRTPFSSQIAAANESRGPSGQPMGSQTKVVVDANEVRARIALSEARALSGQRVGVIIDFDIAPGWHVYGKPLPEEYTPTTVTFDKDLLSAQKLDFPQPKPVKFELLDETLPVYQGHFKVVGDILLRQKLSPGEHRLGGTLSFQECNDNLCKMPRQVRFELPLRIESALPPSPG